MGAKAFQRRDAGDGLPADRAGAVQLPDRLGPRAQRRRRGLGQPVLGMGEGDRAPGGQVGPGGAVGMAPERPAPPVQPGGEVEAVVGVVGRVGEALRQSLPDRAPAGAAEDAGGGALGPAEGEVEAGQHPLARVEPLAQQLGQPVERGGAGGRILRGGGGRVIGTATGDPDAVRAPRGFRRRRPVHRDHRIEAGRGRAPGRTGGRDAGWIGGRTGDRTGDRTGGRVGARDRRRRRDRGGLAHSGAFRCLRTLSGPSG